MSSRVEQIRQIMVRPHRGDECPGDNEVEFLLAELDSALLVVAAARQLCNFLNASGKVYGDYGQLHLALARFDKKQSVEGK